METIDKDVTLPCTAVGNPQPETYWLNNRNEIIDSEIISPRYKVSWNSIRIILTLNVCNRSILTYFEFITQVLSNGDLIISQITWDDMGTYTCVAQNSVGEDRIESFIYPVKKEGRSLNNTKKL